MLQLPAQSLSGFKESHLLVVPQTASKGRNAVELPGRFRFTSSLLFLRKRKKK